MGLLLIRLVRVIMSALLAAWTNLLMVSSTSVRIASLAGSWASDGTARLSPPKHRVVRQLRRVSSMILSFREVAYLKVRAVVSPPAWQHADAPSRTVYTACH